LSTVGINTHEAAINQLHLKSFGEMEIIVAEDAKKCTGEMGTFTTTRREEGS
jgi:hypothetical protein